MRSASFDRSSGWSAALVYGIVRSLHMSKISFKYPWRRRDSLTSVLLALLLFRAYVPVGFMPASGAPFLLELCPAFDAAPMLGAPMLGAHMHHHHAGSHAGSHTHFENCPFGSAPVAGPISLLAAFEPPTPALSEPVTAFDAPRRAARLPNAHLPRGPPSPA
jgi:hypothetical protein